MRDINAAALIVFIAMAILAGTGKQLSDRVRRRRQQPVCCRAILSRPRLRAYQVGAELRHWASHSGVKVPRAAVGRNRYHDQPDDPSRPVTIGAWLAVGHWCVGLTWAHLEQRKSHMSEGERETARRRRKADRERRRLTRLTEQAAKRQRRNERRQRRHDGD